MKYFIPIATIIAIALVVFNATKLNFDALLHGESAAAVMTIFAGLCAILLLQIFRISKKIEKIDKSKNK